MIRSVEATIKARSDARRLRRRRCVRQVQVMEDARDHRRRLNQRHQPQAAQATRTRQHVEPNAPSHQVRPRPIRCGSRVGRRHGLVGSRPVDGRHDVPPPGGPRRQHTVIQDQIHPWLGHECGEPLEQFERFEDDVRRPVAPTPVQLEHDRPVRHRPRAGSAPPAAGARSARGRYSPDAMATRSAQPVPAARPHKRPEPTPWQRLTTLIVASPAISRPAAVADSAKHHGPAEAFSAGPQRGLARLAEAFGRGGLLR